MPHLFRGHTNAENIHEEIFRFKKADYPCVKELSAFNIIKCSTSTLIPTIYILTNPQNIPEQIYMYAH